MHTLDKQTAMERLLRQQSRISPLKTEKRHSTSFKGWERDTEIAIQNIFGEQTRHLEDFRAVRYSPGIFTDATPESDFDKIYQKGLDAASAVLGSLIAEIDEYWAEEPSSQLESTPQSLERICDRFHVVARQLRNRYDNRPTLEIEDEYDAQDLLHCLLMMFFEDIRREEWTPSYAGKSSRMDFLLKAEQIVVEVKRTRKGLGEKQVGDQLLIDIARYSEHPDCQHLVCFVYDPEGRIGNPIGLERDLTKTHGDLSVKVVIAPRR